jgi:hypothetical protein
MPRHQALVAELNAAFSKDQVAQLAQRRDEFAPRKSLDTALTNLVAKRGTVEYRTFKSYLAKIPGSIQEATRSTIYYALGTTPPTLITFAWAPGYDYEITVWQAPDTAETRGGITMLLKSRYPDDKHPLAS